MTFSSDTGK